MLFPLIETARLSLRQPVPPDIGEVFAGLSDPAVVLHYGVPYRSRKETQVQMDYYAHVWDQEEGIYWAICPKGEGRLVGVAGLYNYMPDNGKAEIGFWIMPSHQRQGLMREALTAIIRYGISTLQLHRVEALVEAGNPAATGLLTGLGFAHEGTLRECEMKGEQRISLDMYGLLAAEFAV